MDTVRSDFNHARNHLENTPGLADRATPEQKLGLYGLYKQATNGECTEDAPSMFNVKARMKYDAWKAHSGLSVEEAFRAYTKIVSDLDPGLRLPSHQVQPQANRRQQRALTPVSINGHGSSGSLSALPRTESRDFLDRLLGAPHRLTTPSPSNTTHSELSYTRREEDVEEKSSIDGNGTAATTQSQITKKKLSLMIGRNSSVEELRRMVDDVPSSSSSVQTNSNPATPQNVSASLGAAARMSRSSSLTWGKAEDYTPLIGRDGRRNHRRKSEGDDMELEVDDENEDDESSNMDWDSADDVRRQDRNFSGDNSDEEDSTMDDDMDDEADEYGEARMKRRSRDEGGKDEDETIIGTMLFTMPFVFCFKMYQLMSSVFFLPVTTFLKFFGVQVHKTPDTESVREKKQAASMLLLTSIIPMTPIVYMWVFFLLIFPFTTLPTAGYIVWMLYWDESPRNGSRQPLLKDVPLAKYFVEYFPITLLRKSPPLDASKKYVFAYHPHGIIGLGAFGAFATHAAGFAEKFPGIDMRLLTLDNNFKVPIFREILLGFGVCSCSRKACDQILSRGPGSAITLVVGGAAESLETQKGTYRLVLGRKGFVQVAIDNDADLVPVIAFGETDAFETFSAKRGTLLRDIQVFIQRKIKFTVPIFWGRGMFNTNFGLMPKRRPIHVVTGEPLAIKPFRDRGLEGQALIDAVHRAYIAALRRLFDENKDECEPGVQRKESLTIIN